MNHHKELIKIWLKREKQLGKITSPRQKQQKVFISFKLNTKYMNINEITKLLIKYNKWTKRMKNKR